jgi:AraC-like DNA-binding protein
MTATLLASAARVLWRLMERHGVDPTTVFDAVGLDAGDMQQPRARYPDALARAAWREAARRIDDPCFGLQAVDAWRCTDFHALGYAFLASRNLSTAIERLGRYNAVVDSNVSFEHRVEGAQLRITYRLLDAEIAEPPALQDARWAVLLGLCREAYGAGFSPLEISLTHPAPPCRSEYFGLFRCPVRFSAPVSEMVLDLAQAEALLPAAHRELARANEAILADYLAALGVPDIVSRVKTAIVERLPSGAPSAEIIAADLAMSARTLQRRLADAHASYSVILESVRRELAAQYVTDASRSLAEISFLLGFSEQSAFSRAFRRWHGHSPTEARSAEG